MKITRKFTVAGRDPFDSVSGSKRSSKITNPDGSIVFEMKDAEVPDSWSQLATDIMVSKYFRKAGIPNGDGTTGPEKSARQVIHRLAGCWRYWGEKHGYFDTKEDAQAFYDEIAYMMVHQMCAQQPAVVQHGFELRVWHFGSGAGTLDRRSQDGQARASPTMRTRTRSRTPASSRA